MLNKADIKKEISELAEKIKTLTSDCTDLNALQKSLQDMNEKLIILKYLETIPEEKKPEPQGKISPDVFPDIQEEMRKENPVDLFGNEISVHDKISKSKENQSLAGQLQNKKIDDLKDVIGINEKFRFINDLFDGNANEYNVAINQINTFKLLGEADNYLANLKAVYKWNGENITVLNFTELVYRRFL